MKRDPRLRDLSSDHHQALVLARELRDPQPATLAGLPARFAEELEPHFRIEEERLLPAMEAAGERSLVQRTLDDHAYLRARAAEAAAGDRDAARALGERLAAHVRFEERELFPRAEGLLSDETLARVASAHAPAVRTKRAYEPPSPEDGQRVLVDRLWPRGVRKEALQLDAWCKDVAPSPELRRWFGHEPARWDAFAARYRDELAREPAASALADLVERARGGALTLVYGARDRAHNGAVVLRDLIRDRLGR